MKKIIFLLIIVGLINTKAKAVGELTLINNTCLDIYVGVYAFCEYGHAPTIVGTFGMTLGAGTSIQCQNAAVSCNWNWTMVDGDCWSHWEYAKADYSQTCSIMVPATQGIDFNTVGSGNPNYLYMSATSFEISSCSCEEGCCTPPSGRVDATGGYGAPSPGDCYFRFDN